MWDVDKRNKKEKKMVLVKLKDREEKTEVMRKKSGLKGREKKIEDDLMVKERKMQRRLERIEKEERNGISEVCKDLNGLKVVELG